MIFRLIRENFLIKKKSGQTDGLAGFLGSYSKDRVYCDFDIKSPHEII
jgi:hypothetical protein